MSNNALLNRFKRESFLMYSCPIRVELFNRKMSLKGLCNLMKLNGFIYDYHLLNAVVNGIAFSNFTLHYFTHIYAVLELPLPTPEYLYNSWLRWEEIKAFKKQRAIDNKLIKASRKSKNV